MPSTPQVRATPSMPPISTRCCEICRSRNACAAQFSPGHFQPRQSAVPRANPPSTNFCRSLSTDHGQECGDHFSGCLSRGGQVLARVDDGAIVTKNLPNGSGKGDVQCGPDIDLCHPGGGCT